MCEFCIFSFILLFHSIVFLSLPHLREVKVEPHIVRKIKRAYIILLWGWGGICSSETNNKEHRLVERSVYTERKVC